VRSLPGRKKAAWPAGAKSIDEVCANPFSTAGREVGKSRKRAPPPGETHSLSTGVENRVDARKSLLRRCFSSKRARLSDPPDVGMLAAPYEL
jgi:hypothetical protein